MLSKEIQYQIYAGIRRGDYSGWIKVDPPESQPNVDVYTLGLENGYSIDRFIKKVNGRFIRRKVMFSNIRFDRTVEDTESEYKDVDVSMLVDVKMTVLESELKFDCKDHSFLILSREPVDWETFKDGKPEKKEESTESWSSFYH